MISPLRVISHSARTVSLNDGRNARSTRSNCTDELPDQHENHDRKEAQLRAASPPRAAWRRPSMRPPRLPRAPAPVATWRRTASQTSLRTWLKSSLRIVSSRSPLTIDRDREFLHDPSRPLRHHQHALGQVDGLVDVVGDHDDGLAGRLPQPQQLVLHGLARLRVERAERLVEQQDFRIVGERARDRDALLHAARQFARKAMLEALQADGADEAVTRSPRAASRGTPVISRP